MSWYPLAPIGHITLVLPSRAQGPGEIIPLLGPMALVPESRRRRHHVGAAGAIFLDPVGGRAEGQDCLRGKNEPSGGMFCAPANLVLPPAL
jgi:hypothetical protein